MSEVPRVVVNIFDTTLRDGAQSLPEQNQFADGTKVDVARKIASLGVGVIEAGFPATPGDAEEVEAVTREVGNERPTVAFWRNGHEVASMETRPPTIAGLCRAVETDIVTAWDALQRAEYPRIHTFISTDTDHMRAKFPGKTPEEVMQMGVDAVHFARDLMSAHPNASVQFSAEAASTTNPDYLDRVISSAIQAGADVINLPDTVGQRSPFFMRDFYRRAIETVMRENPEVTVSAHNHDDLGNAVANTFALVAAAGDVATRLGRTVRVQLETTVCGLGERAGNADVFPVVSGLFKFAEEVPAEVFWRFNPGNSVAVAKYVMSQTGEKVHRQSPVVGTDTNTHRSGIHSDGVIKGGHEIYTPHDPRFWGHSKSAVHQDGRYQGRRGREAARA